MADASTPVPDPGSERVERTVFLMGTRLRIRVDDADRSAALRASEAAVDEVRRLESLLSTWRGDSELSRLNRTPVGESFALSPRLGELLAEARRWARETGNAFEPVVGSLVDAWDLRGSGRRPESARLRRALAAVGPGALELRNDATTAVRRHIGAWIDAGGFGKGAALGAAAAALREHGVEGAVLDFGGQVLVVGPGDGGAAEVEVAHPARRNRPAATLSLRDASAATSGASERGVTVDGERVGHLLDPRTGRPVPAWGSVTVVTDDPLAADALSTGLFVMGPRKGMAWARERDDVAVLFLLREEGAPPEARWNRAMERHLRRLGAAVRPGGSGGAFGMDESTH